MHEFEFNGHNYRSTKLNVIRQFHVARKLGPLVTKAGPDFTAAPKDMGQLLQRLSNVMESVADMPTEDADFILHECLSVVRRVVGSQALPVWNTSAKTLMYEDITLPEMLLICREVISDNLAPFLPGPSSNSSEPAAA